LSAFNKAAEVVAKYVKKGDMIHIEGSLRTKKWDDNGVTKYATDIVVGRLNLLGSKTTGDAPPVTETVSSGMPDDDLPF
jgi:single-strand DNA-binding protein